MRSHQSHVGLVASVVAVLVAALVFIFPMGANGDTENCVSKGEYGQLEVGMSPNSVERLFDINGSFGDGGPETFVRKYRTCWNADARVVVVYDNDSGLSLRWRIDD